MKRREFIDDFHGLLDEQFIGEQGGYDLSRDDIEAVRDEVSTFLDKIAAAIRAEDKE